MNQMKMNILQIIRQYQLFGFVVGLIFAHFDHHISLYNWISEQIQEVEVVEEKRWWEK